MTSKILTENFFIYWVRTCVFIHRNSIFWVGWGLGVCIINGRILYTRLYGNMNCFFRKLCLLECVSYPGSILCGVGYVVRAGTLVSWWHWFLQVAWTRPASVWDLWRGHSERSNKVNYWGHLNWTQKIFLFKSLILDENTQHLPSLPSFFLRSALYFSFLARCIITCAVFASLKPLQERKVHVHIFCLVLYALLNIERKSKKHEFSKKANKRHLVGISLP